jgi:N-acetylmuramic acid 6-phosphate etherase
MIRVGKSYGNLMVDLRATNVKLQDRAERIVCEVTALDRDAARALLQQADGRVKRALVMHALHVDAATADAQLEAAGGVIRKVVPNAPPPVAHD